MYNYSFINVMFVVILLNSIVISQQLNHNYEVDTIFTDNQVTAIYTFDNKAGRVLISNSITSVSYSNDYGDTWIASDYEGASYIPFGYDFSFHPENSESGYLAGGEIIKTNDSGESWIFTGKLEGLYNIAIHPYIPEIILGWGLQEPGIGPYYYYRSEDGGETWNQTSGKMLRGFQFDSDNFNIIYAYHNNGIKKSTDYGKTWNNKNTGLYQNDYLPTINGFKINKQNPEVLYCAQSGFLHKSTNGGESWYNIDSSLKEIVNDPSLIDLFIDERQEGRLLVSVLSNSYDGLLLTKDDGKTWRKIFSGRINFIEADNNNPRTIYCGTNFGAIRLNDTTEVSIVEDEENIFEFSLSQNYPNPFNPTTNITYQIPQAGNIKIQLYDILGRQVRTLVDSYKTKGKYKITFNGSGLPSGVYIYRIKSGEFTASKKLVLMK